MSNPRRSTKTSQSPALPARSLAAPPVTEVEVPLLPEAPTIAPRRAIYTQRITPTVPEGEATPDLTPSQQIGLPPRSAVLAADAQSMADALLLLKNTALGSAADNNTASNVGEPSVATNRNVVFYTGNWYAALSTDGGDSFRYVDPSRAFPVPTGMRFCCDQIVHYIRKIDTFVWLLQYTENGDGENIQRLAFATTAEIQQGHWRLFDLRPQDLGLPGVFLDFPDLAVGTNMLYVTTNSFMGENWHATLLLRLPLAGIASGQITAQQTLSRENFNFRVAQQCSRQVYWASHNTTSSLRVFRWPESAAQPTFADVSVASWVDGNNFDAQTPDGRNWLARADPRILGATKARGDLWFAWNANRGGANDRPQPYVQIARLRARDLSLVENINLWDEEAAIGYPALATNSRQEVGVTYMIGGGTRHPSHVVGILSGQRREVITAEGARSPLDKQWGDFLTIRRHHPNTRLFAATGYTLEQGEGNRDATPRFVLFGRTRDL